MTTSRGGKPNSRRAERIAPTDTIEALRSIDPLDLLHGLILESGERWGDVAEPWQWDDARAIIDAATGKAYAKRRQFLLRGRGMSKSTDVAAVVLALMLTRAPERSRSYCWAADADQARIVLDYLHGFAERSGLLRHFDIGATLLEVKATAATFAVEAADGASAYGLKPWLSVVDELGVWPATENHRRLWAAIVSALPKRKDSVLVCITTAGSPVGLGAKVWAEAESSRLWRAVRRPGPAPWFSAEDIEGARAGLTSAEWSRLFECVWAEGDDTLAIADDVEACIRAGSVIIPAQRGREYVAALDVGTRRDLTALVVGHAERDSTGRRIVIDVVRYWRPTRTERVDLDEVETSALALCREYGVRRLRFDRMQAEQLTRNLDRAGVRTDEYVFSASGANRLARALASAIRDHGLSLPDDEEVRSEFLTTRLVETGPSTLKLSNPTGSHDDIVTAVGMVLVDLAERPEVGRGAIYTARDFKAPERARRYEQPRAPVLTAARFRARKMPGGLPGGGATTGVPGAYDDPNRIPPRLGLDL